MTEAYTVLSTPTSTSHVSYTEFSSPTASDIRSELASAGNDGGSSSEYMEPSALPRGYGPAADQVRKDAYTWDLCLVFAIGDPDKEVTTRVKVDNHVKKLKRKEQDIFSERAAGVIKSVKSSGLKYCLYKSAKEDQVFMLIAGTEERLREEADRIDYDLELDAVNTLKLGVERKLKLATMTVDESNERYSQFQESQWQGLFGPYKKPDNKNPKRDLLYRHWEKEDGSQSPFRASDRIKLTINILEADEIQHGAGIIAAKFIKSNDHPLVAMFPLHDLPTRAKIWEECRVWYAVFHIPIQPIRNYFGEQIGLYFGFLQFYSAALLIPSFFGILCFIWQLGLGTIEVKGLPIYAIIVAIWATFFLEMWKRKEVIYQYRWGMAKFSEKEEPRPQFHGTWVPSPIDGKMVVLFPTYQKIARAFMGHSVVVFCGALATVAAAGLLYARSVWILLAPGNAIELQVAASVLNAIQVQIGNMLYKRVAAWLNEWENYRTETEYENALIFKSFLFEWINSYATLIYIAFFKQMDPATGCAGENCLSELRVQLGMVFITQLVVSNFIELAKPMFAVCQATKKMNEMETPDRQASGPEEEYALEIYDSPFSDFDEIVIQYGYATLFVVALPITPLLYLFNNIIEMYLDSYKLCKLTRRPEPRGAANIGTWQSMLNLQGYLAVISNCALITLVASQSVDLETAKLENNSVLPALIAFIVSEHLLIILKQGIAVFVPDIPESVLIRQRRQDYIVNALIWEMDVEEIKEDDIDRMNDPEAAVTGDHLIIDDKNQEASTRNVLENYQLSRIPTTFKLGMQAVSGKAAYGEAQTSGLV